MCDRLRSQSVHRVKYDRRTVPHSLQRLFLFIQWNVLLSAVILILLERLVSRVKRLLLAVTVLDVIPTHVSAVELTPQRA